MARRNAPILYFDDLSVGDEWETPARTVTEADVVNFACLSGDFNPIHVDQAFASKGAFGEPVAHGLLGLAIASGLGSNHPRVDTMALLAIQDWNFLQPIAFGDTIHCLTSVVSLEPTARGKRGIVTWRRQIVNQLGKAVQEGRYQTLVRSRPKAAAPAEDA